MTSCVGSFLPKDICFWRINVDIKGMWKKPLKHRPRCQLQKGWIITFISSGDPPLLWWQRNPDRNSVHLQNQESKEPQFHAAQFRWLPVKCYVVKNICEWKRMTFHQICTPIFTWYFLQFHSWKQSWQL